MQVAMITYWLTLMASPDFSFNILTLQETTALTYQVSAPVSKRKGFFEETPGCRSSMRLMSMMALISAIIFAGLTVSRPPVEVRNTDNSVRLVHPPYDQSSIYIIFGFLIAAFAPKAIQKFAEEKLPTFDPKYVSMVTTTAGEGVTDMERRRLQPSITQGRQEGSNIAQTSGSSQATFNTQESPMVDHLARLQQRGR